MIKVLLIVAQYGYQPLEYGLTRQELEKAGFTVTVASNKTGTAYSNPSKKHDDSCDDSHCRTTATKYPDFAQVPVDVALADVNPAAYDGIFLVGGPGGLEHLDNKTVHQIVQKAYELSKVIGAICISPRILAHAGLLQGKKATGWNDDHKLDDLFKQYHAIYIKSPVVTDGNIITADGPRAASAFGKAIVTQLNIAS